MAILARIANAMHKQIFIFGFATRRAKSCAYRKIPILDWQKPLLIYFLTHKSLKIASSWKMDAIGDVLKNLAFQKLFINCVILFFIFHKNLITNELSIF
jgi:hypothetical protein